MAPAPDPARTRGRGKAVLEPVEVPYLPLAAALFDRDGELVAATPEWTGPAPGSAAYATGFGHLVVAAEGAPRHLDRILGRLLEELAAAAASMSPTPARRLEVLRAGLELVSGRPPSGPAGDVAELVRASLPARAPGLRLELEPAPPWPPLASAGAVALALVQLAVNAQRHEQAEVVRLRLAHGSTFYIEWPAASPAPAPAVVATHRHLARRRRWGWGYVQMVADALGGVALPPGPTGTDLEGAALSLGSTRLGLPLAVVRDGRLERWTQAWEQERPASASPGQLDPGLRRLLAGAEARPGQIVYQDLYRARQVRDRTWLVQPPETGSNRARDVLRGLDHERVLWTAPEPHSTRVHALACLLAIALGEPAPAVPPSIWSEAFPAACLALGMQPPEVPDSLVLPDPRLAAFLLAELGGSLVAQGEGLALSLAAPETEQPLLEALGYRAGISIALV